MRQLLRDDPHFFLVNHYNVGEWCIAFGHEHVPAGALVTLQLAERSQFLTGKGVR
jgi:hypothetical protein